MTNSLVPWRMINLEQFSIMQNFPLFLKMNAELGSYKNPSLAPILSYILQCLQNLFPWDLNFSQRRLWRVVCSEIYPHVVLWKQSRAYWMFYAGFLLGLFNREDGGGIFLQKSVDYQRIKWCYIPEDRTDFLFREISLNIILPYTPILELSWYSD